MIRLERVTKGYVQEGGTAVVLDGLDLRVERGSFCAVMGPRGAGKSTLLNIVGGIDHADLGEVAVDGADLTCLSDSELAAWRAENIGFVSRGFNLIPVLSVYENVELPLLLSPLDPGERIEHVERAVGLVGLFEQMRHRPVHLSAEQAQRAAFARALVTDPDLILADEPTAGLDRKSGDRLVDLFFSLNDELGKTILIATQDVRVAERASRVIRLERGRVVEQRSMAGAGGSAGLGYFRGW
ncbi:MAG: ATP-binding cassette domain-containing protein [Planctomycetota bacterium]